MYCLAIAFFLPITNAIVIVQTHRNSFYNPVSSCSFIHNTLLSNDASIQSCIWECVNEYDCQTAVYFHDNKTCSMYAELCTTGSIEPYVNDRASVICYRKNHQPIITCSTTSAFGVITSTIQVPSREYSTTFSAVSGSPVTTTLDSSKLEISGPLVNLTRAGDMIIGIYNTTAGQSTSVSNGLYHPSENSPNVVDEDTTTKHYTWASTAGSGNIQGIDTGFVILTSISNATVARALLFATANDCPNRDPLTVTLEGSNATSNETLLLDSSWTLIYNGPTGIDPSADPGRYTYIIQQNFSNTQIFSSYRLLVTSVRSNSDGVQYSEAHILGYVLI